MTGNGCECVTHISNDLNPEERPCRDEQNVNCSFHNRKLSVQLGNEQNLRL